MLELILGRQVLDYELALVIWNLSLAILPCYVAHIMWRERGKKGAKFSIKKRLAYVGGFLLWLFFFPNTAYLIAMVRHLLAHCKTYDLYHVCKEGTWLVPLFFTYALAAVPTFIYALRKMTQLMGAFFGSMMERAFPALMIPVTAFGLLLGLVARYNSWDVATRPLDVLQTSWEYLNDTTMLLNWLVYTLTLYALYYGLPPLMRKALNS